MNCSLQFLFHLLLHTVHPPSLPKNAAVLFTVDESNSLVPVAVFIGPAEKPYPHFK